MQNLTWKAAGRLIRNGSAAAILRISTTATAAPMFMGLGDLAGGAFRSTASAVSADGSTVVGSSIGDSTYNGGHEAIRWTRASRLEAELNCSQHRDSQKGWLRAAAGCSLPQRSYSSDGEQTAY